MLNVHIGSPQEDQTLSKANAHFKPLVIRKTSLKSNLENQSMRKYKPTIHTQIIYTSFPKVSAFSIAYVKKKKKKESKY